MNLLDLLGLNLKDPRIIDVLEHLDVPVIYEFDRLFEGQPDHYTVEAGSAGLELRFDQDQRLITIFIILEPIHGFTPYPADRLSFETFSSFEAARAYATENSLAFSQYREGAGIPQWIRIERETHFTHYQFSDSGVSRITLMLPDTAPGSR